MRQISVAQPSLLGNEFKYVKDCLDTNWISSNGKYIELFEKKFADFCNTKYAVATNNGTTSLHLSLVALNLQLGDEVLIPTVTYIATANTVTYCGAKPILVDVCPRTLNILPGEIEKKITSKTKGIIAVHLYGHPADMDEIQKIAKKYNLWVLEDAAEAHGAEVNGRKVGGIGNCGSFSFFGNKIITTGEGGIVTTNDYDLYEKLKLFRGQGMDPKRRYWFPVIGYNYRMTNIQAAIGLAQLEEIDKILKKREELAKFYNEELENLKDYITIPEKFSWAKKVHWMYNIFLKDGGELQRDNLIKYLSSKGIETRPIFYPMHVLPPYIEKKSFPNADLVTYRGISLPTHLGVSSEDVKYIVNMLSTFFESFKKTA